MFDYFDRVPDHGPMGRGRPKPPVRLYAKQRELLELLAIPRKVHRTAGLDRRGRQAVAMRARIILAAAEGRNNVEVATALGISRQTVSRWRSRFVARGLDGLLDAAPRTGHRLAEETTFMVETRRLRGDSTRKIAEDIKVSQSSVVRILKRIGAD